MTTGGGRSMVAWSPLAESGALPPEPQLVEIGQDGVVSPSFEIPTGGDLPALSAGPGLQVLAAYQRSEGDGPELHTHVMLRFIGPDNGDGDANGGEAVTAQATPPATKAVARNQPQRVSRSKRASSKRKR